MYRYFAVQEFEKKEMERKERIRKNDLMLINHSLQRTLQELKSEEIMEKFKELAERLSWDLVQCSVWDIRYANNLESEKTALVQVELIEAILASEDQPNLRISNELRNIRRRLSFV